MTQKKGEEKMNATKELQEEMVGVLTAISIVSKRLANRLVDLEKESEEEQREKPKMKGAKK